jgi:hypothetical protein
MSNTNANCDGSGPCILNGEVRVLPTGGTDGYGSNGILCLLCYRREIDFRKSRNKELSKDCQFQLPKWQSLKIYGKD